MLLPALVLLLASAVKIIWNQAHDPLRPLSASQSRTLYESNLKNFTGSCLAIVTDAPAELVTFCSHEAALLRRLPDCDPDCMRLTASFASAPTR